MSDWEKRDGTRTGTRWPPTGDSLVAQANSHTGFLYSQKINAVLRIILPMTKAKQSLQVVLDK